MSKIHKLYPSEKPIDKEEAQERRGVIYAIASVLDNYKETRCVYVNIRVCGTSTSFQKPISEVYKKKWLNGFSKEDVAYIAFLYAAEETENFKLIEQFPRKKQRITKSVVILAVLFVTFLILSNITAFKVCQIKIDNLLWYQLPNEWKIDFPAALLLFPLTYFFDDAITEVYGFKISRLVIWSGLASNTIFTLGASALVYLPASPMWELHSNHGQEAYRQIFEGSWRIFFASATAYFFGEFINSIILSKLKILTSGKYFLLRVIGSTAIGVGVDSVIFCNIAFRTILPMELVWKLVITQYIFKLSYEVLMLPLTYFLTSLLKKIDNADYYDFKTKYNPFSLNLEENV